MALPHYFERLREQDLPSGLQPFRFDHEKRMFVIGDKKVPAARFDPQTYDPSDHNLDPEGIPVDEMTDHSALISADGKLLGTPQLHDWVGSRSNHWRLNDTAATAMAEASAATDPDRSELYLGKPVDMFSVTNSPHVGLFLRVFGGTAGLSASRSDGMVEGQAEESFVEYKFLFATQKHRTILSAGLGSLAAVSAMQRV